MALAAEFAAYPIVCYYSTKEDRHNLKSRSAAVIAILLLLVTLLALGLRLYQLDAQSLWYDEAFSVYLARMDLAEISTRTAADIQPPLYYYLLHAWIGPFGDSAEALRGLSLLFGVLTVPLMYGVAWQLLRSRLASLLAALLVAVSPLHIWYGQEARMYTLLAFLCLLSSYWLLLLVKRLSILPSEGDREPRPRQVWWTGTLWLAFTLTNIAALYTHYFSVFVLACQAIYLVVVWWGQSLRPIRLVVGGLASGVVTIGAYLPWLPHLLARYGADVSYWPGQLKLHEVFLDTVLSFIGGESIPEQVGIFLAIGYGLVLTLCLLALLSTDRGQIPHENIPTLPEGAEDSSFRPLPPAYYPLLFLLLYLLLPPALILALSYNAPKFNARYLMVSQPAFLLILAGGLGALWRRRPGTVGKFWRGVLAGLALGFVLGVSAYANHNTYTDLAFARADFRGVARYLEGQLAPDETIILSSGHMFPVFDYYAPGIERHLLPDSPTLDTTRVLDYSIAADLNRWLAGRGGVWLVLWQYEVVDPAGYLTTILAQGGEQQPVGRTFAKVELQHYRLPSDAVFSDQPVIAHPADFNFGDRLRLLGYSQTGEKQVTLFWQASQPLEEDYRVSLTLRDTVGQSWGQWDGRPTAYLYPTDRWPVGETIFGRYNLALLPGSPPGDYGLEVGVYTEADPVGLDVLDSAGAPQGKRAMLGAVRLSVPAVTADQVDIPNPVGADLGGGLTLLGWELSRDEAQPGDRLLLTLVWSVESKPQGDYVVRVLVADAAGQTWDAGTFPPTNFWHPTSIWLPGQAWRGLSTFRLPIQTQPGEANLSIQLVDAGRVPLGMAAELTAIQVLPTSRVFTPPQPQAPRRANFDDRISLLGADLVPDPVAPGGALRVTLYWQALSEMDVPYAVFVHLLGVDGRSVAGHDSEPVDGTRPTTGWVPGEYIIDSHDLSIPADLPPGAYVIEVGLYDAGAPNMPRLLILGEEGQGEADRVIFGPVQVR
jgi:mannosyltransferase